ncbi:hypothetical protein RDI58_029136 [Solanum bulbocastanum]|uniref:RNase H type-1 domain-containing protein n=1 Tax=Solanum bulbocastanum TaxID=147425 RepID=A0AAN8SW88_SOLBU
MMNHVSTNWPGMVVLLQNYKPKIFSLAVTWKPLHGEMLKCNTDGASRRNLSKSSYFYCLRIHKRDLIIAKGEEIHETTNNEAEATVIKEASYHWVSIILNKVILENDHLVTVPIISRVWEIAWKNSTIIGDINALAQLCQVRIQHIVIEGNSLAYYIASIPFERAG